MSNLAINSGPRQMTIDYPQWPIFDDDEINAVTAVIKSGKWGGDWGGKWWRGFSGWRAENNDDLSDNSGTPQVVLFQDEFARYHNAAHAVACANGSVAIEVALRALGIGPGDEVIVPPYTFIATASSVLLVNAVPVFVDIDPQTYNMDPARIEEAITERTKAIIPVHFAGQLCDMDRIMDIAKKHNLFVIEDCAHAHGSEWRGRKAGTIGDIGTFSFQSSKTMTSGEGGIIITNNEALAIKCHSFIWVGRDFGKPWYEFQHLGSNYRLTEFQGAVLRVQLSRLEKQIETRMENVRYLSEKLRGIPGIKLVKWDERATKHGFYLIMMQFDSTIWGVPRSSFIKALAAEGVNVSPPYPVPLYNNEVFLNQNFYPKSCPVKCPRYSGCVDYGSFAEKCPVAEHACREESLWLGHSMFLGSRKVMDAIAESIRKIWDNKNELK